MISEERIADLEMRLTYQEATLNELNDVIIQQQKQIDALMTHVKRIKEQTEQQAELVRPLSEETPPPHY